MPRSVCFLFIHVPIRVLAPSAICTFERFLPGNGRQYIEPMSGDLNVENPPLDPNDPSVHDRYLSEQYGAVQHVCLEVTDMRSARDAVQARGGYDDLRVHAHVGNVRRWLVYLFDPDGSPTELMETMLQTTLPAMTVMASGAPAPPMLPKRPGVLPWP